MVRHRQQVQAWSRSPAGWSPTSSGNMGRREPA